MKRRAHAAALVSAMAVTAVNIPIGATVGGLFVASRLTGGDAQISMGAVAAFVLVAGGLALGLTVVLGHLGARHDALRGRTHARRHVAWMRPMSDERVNVQGALRRAGALDVVLVVVVVAMLLAFEAWLLFYSGSPLDGGSGRD